MAGTQYKKLLEWDTISEDERTELVNLTKMDLGWHDYYDTITPEIGRLTNLTRLELQCSEIFSLPETIGDLSSLKELILYGNNLTTLPETIGNLSKLEYLTLEKNQLTALPQSICNLSNLIVLDLSRNDLTTLPETIGNLSNLRRLKVYRNKLTTLPQTLGNLSKLEYLTLDDIVAMPSLPHDNVDITSFPGKHSYKKCAKCKSIQKFLS